MAHEIFLDGSFSFRKRTTLVGGLLLLFFAGLMAFETVWWFIDDEASRSIEWLTLLSLAIVAAGIGAGAIWIIYGYITRRTYRVVIDPAGVRDGRQFYPWKQIDRLYLMREGSSHTLVYVLRSIGKEVELHVDDMPASDQCEELLGRIAAIVGRQHPHVRFG